MWGQAQYCFAVAPGHRIIPMRVGTRSICSPIASYTADHPHACGDKFPFRWRLNTTMGSSPCVWGQDSAVKILQGLRRIIPMRVGTRHKSLKFSDDIKDHPHACGDKILLACRLFGCSRSSPCVWGQDHARHRRNNKV